ncbi:Lrp/AsnC family transcriptional regulator [Candidatus Woesearchaeota archaeon]|nr:Lrp/AsnC family transcriptional regulator [Candidatus Woesearchaeota archaeon]
MESNGLSSNEKKILDNIGGCVKIDIPSLAEKTGLSKPTVRSIVNKFLGAHAIALNAAMVPEALGLEIMTVYEISYPPAMHGESLTKHIQDTLAASNHAAVVMKINPSQSIVVAFYTCLEHKDVSFARMMQHLTSKEGANFNPMIKELWTRPSRDFFYDANISKFLKGIEHFNNRSKG